MAEVVYNNISLPYSNITDFKLEVLYDEEAHTDPYLYRYDIKLDCVLTTPLVEYMRKQDVLDVGESGFEHNPALLLKFIRRALLTPRKTLSIKFNGIELMPAAQGDNSNATLPGTVDARNGPKPQSCQLIQLSNTTFLLTYHIIAHYQENFVSGGGSLNATGHNKTGNMVLYNRWSETVDIDQNLFSTYTRSGKLVIRSDNTTGRIADTIREQMAIVGIRRGFLRVKSNYQLAPDGLALKYTVDDAEFFKPPPSNATKAEGTYTESTTTGGATRYGEVLLRLEAPKDVPQHTLMKKAVSICMKKLRDNGGGDGFERGKNAMVLHAGYIRADMYHNRVEVMLKAFMKGPRQRIAGVAIADPHRTMVATPESDGETLPGVLPTTRGTANVLLQAAAYYDPTIPGRYLVTRQQPTTANLTAPPVPTVLPGDEVGTLGKKLEP